MGRESKKKSWTDLLKDAFTNATISAAMAENPSIMTASGWSKDPKTGKMSQRQTAATDKLADNLGVISSIADVTSPAEGIISIAKAIRHPIRTAKAIVETVKSMGSAVRSGVTAAKEGIRTATKTAKRTKAYKQLTAPSRAKRVVESEQKLAVKRQDLTRKYRQLQIKAGHKASEIASNTKNTGANNTSRRFMKKVNWDHITKEKDAVAIMKKTNHLFENKVKIGEGSEVGAPPGVKRAYVDVTHSDGYNPNSYVNAGDYEVPVFGTDDVVKGTSVIKSGHITNQRVTPQDVIDLTPSGDDLITREGFDELRKVLLKDIDYLKTEIPGFKPFGSAEGVSQGALSHNTHDIDGYISREMFDKFSKTHPTKTSTPNETYVYNVGDGKYGESGNIDLNLIDVSSDGTINNERTAEIYRQFFPFEYLKQARTAATTPNKVQLKALDSNGTPMTSQLLSEAFDPLTKSIMDAIEINFDNFAKAKHTGRFLEYLAGDRPDAVHAALQQTAKMAGEKGHLLPKMQFGSFDDNIALLNKIGFKGDLENIAKSPEKMQNVLDYWYLSGRTNLRRVNAGDINENGGTLKKLRRNLTEWNASDDATGGHGSGAGLNTIQDGPAGMGSRSIHALILPHIKGLENMTDPNQVVDLVDYANGVRFTDDQMSQISKYMGVTPTQSFPAGSVILNQIPCSGASVKSELQGLADTYGINALRGDSYGNTYSGIIRRLGEADAIGTNAGDAFVSSRGYYTEFPSWSSRMDRASFNYSNPAYSYTPPYVFLKLYALPLAHLDYPSHMLWQFSRLFGGRADEMARSTYSMQKARRLAQQVQSQQRTANNIGSALGAGLIGVGIPIGIKNAFDLRSTPQNLAKAYAHDIAYDYYNGMGRVANQTNQLLEAQSRKLGVPVSRHYSRDMGNYGMNLFEQELYDKFTTVNRGDAYKIMDDLLSPKEKYEETHDD